MIRFRRRSWRGALQSAWCAVYRRRTCCRALAPSAGRNCWAIRSVLVEPTIGYCTCRFRRPKTISHDDAIAASCASLRHSGRGREADVLMYPAALSARAFSIAKLFVPSCTLRHVSIPLSLYHWEFRLTLNVIARILREVVNRVKLGDQHARRGSRGEVQSRVVRRRDRDRDRDRDKDRDSDSDRDKDEIEIEIATATPGVSSK